VQRNGYRLTGREEAFVCFIGRWQGVEARQLADWFGMDQAHVYRRAGLLVAEGMIEHHRLLHGRPGVYLATRAGLDWVNLRLPVARPNLATWEHNVELVWLSMELAREFSSAGVLTEREIRSRDTSTAWTAFRNRDPLRPQYAVKTSGRLGPGGLHFPDLVVECGGPTDGLLAIELELTPKPASRRRQIISAYRDGVHIEQVRYYARPEPLRLLEKTIKAERAEEIFDLRPWPGAPR